VPSDHGYTKIPNSFLRFLSKTPITPQHAMMLFAVIRNCHGFHKPDRIFGLKDLNRWLAWDRRRISQTAKELVERGCFCPCQTDKKSPNYRMQNDSRKWNRNWNQRAARKSVDNPVDKPISCPCLADSSASCTDTLSVTNGHDHELSTAEPSWSGDSKTLIEQAFEGASPSNIRDMLDFLKKSLKKSLKKEDSDLQKRKNQIFGAMSRSGLWRDDELIDLAKNLTAAELEDLHAQRRQAAS